MTLLVLPPIVAQPRASVIRKLAAYHHTTPEALLQDDVIAHAIALEATLSFLGLGLPAEIPTWGNIMAEGRVQFSQYPGNVLFPALFLVPTVLAINLLGDGLRDVLDPKFSKRV